MYIKSVIEEIFVKDIKKRVKIRNVEVFEAVRNFLINNFGATISVQSLQKSLIKIGLSVQRATLKRYTDNRINYGPALENMLYLYAKGMDYSVSVGRIGRMECDFILRDMEQKYSLRI